MLSPALCVGYATFTDQFPVSAPIILAPSTTSCGLGIYINCVCVGVCAFRRSRSFSRLLWSHSLLCGLCHISAPVGVLFADFICSVSISCHFQKEQILYAVTEQMENCKVTSHRHSGSHETRTNMHSVF